MGTGIGALGPSLFQIKKQNSHFHFPTILLHFIIYETKESNDPNIKPRLPSRHRLRLSLPDLDEQPGQWGFDQHAESASVHPRECMSVARHAHSTSIHHHNRQFRSPAMIRTTLAIILFTIATSRITDAADPSFNDKYFAAMESVAPTPPKAPKIKKAPVVRKTTEKTTAPSTTFDGVYIRNASGDVIGMRTRCKACRIGR